MPPLGVSKGGHQATQGIGQVELRVVAIQRAYEAPGQEVVVGDVPLSVRAFWSEVGAVNLVGAHPHWEGLFQRYMGRGLEPQISIRSSSRVFLSVCSICMHTSVH
jgi:hypothetical protein